MSKVEEWDSVDLKHYQRYSEIIPNFEEFLRVIRKPLPYSIRVNTLKTTPEDLIPRLELRGFKLERVEWHEWFYIITDLGKLGQPGKTLEHTLGYYYVQELVSGLPPLVLDPEPGELVLDMAAAPGSKTTQMAQMMENRGTIVANDVDMDRISALKSNIDRLGVTNTVITRSDARKLSLPVKFDRILLDAPCSSEGIVRKDPTASGKVSLREIRHLSRLQKGMVRNAYSLLKEGGVLVYSVCTFSPEECEEVVDFAVKLGFTTEEVRVPMRTVKGLRKWKDERGREVVFDPEVEKAVRIYPHMNDSGGMFIAKLVKVSSSERV